MFNKLKIKLKKWWKGLLTFLGIGAVAFALTFNGAIEELVPNVALETVCVSNDGTNARFFAEVENGVVLRVLVAQPEVLNTGRWGSPDRWVETCYGGEGERKNYGGKGHTFDKTRDAFIRPKPYASWELDETTARWKAPKPFPADGKDYRWDEPNINWKEQ